MCYQGIEDLKLKLFSSSIGVSAYLRFLTYDAIALSDA